MDTGDTIKEQISKHEQEIKDLKAKELKANTDTKAKIDAQIEKQIKDLKSKNAAAKAK